MYTKNGSSIPQAVITGSLDSALAQFDSSDPALHFIQMVDAATSIDPWRTQGYTLHYDSEGSLPATDAALEGMVALTSSAVTGNSALYLNIGAAGWDKIQDYGTKANEDIPWATPPATYLVDPTYGELVAYYNVLGYNAANGYELNAVESNVITALSPTYENHYALDVHFAAKLAAGTTITYVFTRTSGVTYTQRYAIADLLLCNVRPINATTIGPSAFAWGGPGTNSQGFQAHWHQETTGNTFSGSDYSFMMFGDETSGATKNFQWNNSFVAPFPTSGAAGPITMDQGATNGAKVAIYIV